MFIQRVQLWLNLSMREFTGILNFAISERIQIMNIVKTDA